MRTIVIGDVHGCYEELTRLEDLLEISSTDRVIMLGDLLDRGPRPLDCLRYVRRRGWEVLLSNHEQKHLEYHRRELGAANGGPPNRMKPFTGERLEQHLALTDEDYAWIERLPFYARFTSGGRRKREWLAVHAGIPTDVPLEHALAHDGVLRCRWVHRDTGRQAGRLDPKADEVFWTKRWRGPESVVYGHEPHGLELPRWEEDLPIGIDCLGLDTGAVYGGRLSAAVFGTGGDIPEIVQVQASRAHARWSAR